MTRTLLACLLALAPALALAQSTTQESGHGPAVDPLSVSGQPGNFAASADPAAKGALPAAPQAGVGRVHPVVAGRTTGRARRDANPAAQEEASAASATAGSLVGVVAMLRALEALREDSSRPVEPVSR